MPRRYYSSTAARTTLASGVDDTTTTFTVVAVSGWPASYPYTLIIDQDTINEEVVSVTNRSGTTLTVTRGVDGTSAVSHSAGAAVNHGVSARDFNEPNQFLNEGGTVTGETVVSSSGSGTTLEVRNTGTGNSFVVEDSANPDATPFVVDASGNVGIGTSSPANLLQIANNSGAAAELIESASDTSTMTSRLVLRRSRGTLASPSAVQSGDHLGRYGARGYGATAYSSDDRGSIVFRADENWTDSAHGSRIEIYTVANGATSQTERMRIDSAGVVSIHSNPTTNRPRIILSAPDDGTNYRHLLGANLAVDSSGTFTTPSSAISGGGWLYSAANSGGAHGVMSYVSAEDSNTTSATAVERMRIDSSGNVGIGTSSPASTLDISVAANPNMYLRNTGDTSADRAVTLNFSHSNGVGARIRMTRASGDSDGGYLSLDTEPVGGSITERVRITSAGNVGIGTSSPSTLLEVASNGATSTATIRITDTDTTGAAGQKIGALEFYQSDSSGGAGVGAAVKAEHLDVSGNTALLFETEEVERMRINNVGNVGIGTSSPEQALHLKSASSFLPQAIVENNNTDGNAGYVILRKAPSDDSITADDTLGSIAFQGVDTSGTARTAAAILGQAAVQGATGVEGRIRFQLYGSGGSGTERMRIDNAGLITGSGTSLGAWTAYTPTLGGTGWAIGNGTATGYYCQIGKIVLFRAVIVFGTTSTFGSANPTVSLPVTAITIGSPNYGRYYPNNASCIDSSTATSYQLAADSLSTTVINIRALASHAYTTLNSTTPFTWASSDTLSVSGIYQAA